MTTTCAFEAVQTLGRAGGVEHEALQRELVANRRSVGETLRFPFRDLFLTRSRRTCVASFTLHYAALLKDDFPTMRFTRHWHRDR